MAHGNYNVAWNGTNISNWLNSAEECEVYVQNILNGAKRKRIKVKSGILINLDKGSVFDIIDNKNFKILTSTIIQ